MGSDQIQRAGRDLVTTLAGIFKSKQKINIVMFSTFFWPYNYLPPEFSHCAFFQQPTFNIHYQGLPTALIPISPEPPIQNPPSNNSLNPQRKKIIERPIKDLETKNQRKSSERRRSSMNFEQYTSKFQNAQRNLLSNLLHHLVSFIMKDPQFKQIMEKIIALNHLNVNFQDVIEFISRIRLRSYIKVTTIQDLWSRNNPHKELSKAFRIFSYYFFKQKSYLLVCDSKRIKSGTKIQHLIKIRALIKYLFLA